MVVIVVAMLLLMFKVVTKRKTRSFAPLSFARHLLRYSSNVRTPSFDRKGPVFYLLMTFILLS